jgi:hypothetical protein
MDLKNLIARLAYKIEPKPEGGFIARATDPTVPPLEAPTREELQQKIRENMLNLVSTEAFGAKLPADGRHHQMSFHVEHKPGGGFTIHSADPNTPVIEVADLKELEAHFLGKYAGLADKFLIPMLTKAFAAQAGAGTMEIKVDSTTSSFTKSGTKAFTFGTPNSFSVSQRASTEMPSLTDPSTVLTNLNGSIGNDPITPESSNIWKTFCFVLLAILAAALVYVFLLHR